MDKSHPIYIKTNTDSGIDIEKALEVMGVEDKKMLNRHQKASIHKNLAGADTNGERLGNAIVYDVRFTKVMDGYDDIFSMQAGLDSNVYGRENQMAKDLRALNNDKRNNKLNNTYDDTQYRTINIQNIKDIRQSTQIMTSNINYFLRMNKWGDIANAKNFKDALNNLLTYEVNRDKDIQNKELTKEIAFAFLGSFFNVWQDGRKFNLPHNAFFNTKREYRACFYVIRQSCDVILGRNFGLRGVTREAVEPIDNQQVNQPIEITGIQEPTMDDFLNFVGVDKNELESNGENKPLDNNNNANQDMNINQNQDIQTESIEMIKEEFNSFLNRLNKVLL